MRSGSKSFSTKNGVCHLYPDRIEIDRQDWVGVLSRFLFKKGYQRAWVLYLLLTLAMVIGLILSLSIANYFLVFFFVVMSLASVAAAFKNRDLSFIPVIPKKSIEKVVYRKAIESQSRAAFTIYFRPENRLMRRMILLPTRTHQGTSLADTAYWMMRDEGLVE